jgi:hypothetical protein
MNMIYLCAMYTGDATLRRSAQGVDGHGLSLSPSLSLFSLHLSCIPAHARRGHSRTKSVPQCRIEPKPVLKQTGSQVPKPRRRARVDRV